MGRARDLDNSLDEIIKNKNKRGIKKGTPHITRQNQTRQYSNATPQQRNPAIRRMDNRAIQKRTSHPINNRLGTKVPPSKPMTTQIKGQRPVGPIITKTIRPTNYTENVDKRKPSIDPSTLIITKAVTPVTKSKAPARAKSPPAPYPPQKQKQPKQTPQTIQQEPAVVSTVFQQKSIDPRERTSIVLLCNLDPRATAEDVGETCSMFGPILSCDMLLDPMGRPLHEAEVEFMYPQSAQECVAKLDGEIADGRVLRARLQYRPTPPVVPRYSSRTVGVSARLGFNNGTQ
ncbi:hypothetical protein BCV72DRAFT_218718 [Rhizopus microsporus var. microsporus]|uniref:RRM domain-containing protein n=2 Tax=Rhizopus microsporus TaxID=58291 RepID=A0A2G4SZX2_RHIZD|nr:uncharacterized protein RHIMIDRAFT_278799 [Rhizopus microsporus ATCC 52813]ORE11994.1 hypothetical protein BCV72DRAFT_218718 [Rhizopus microsporus var. microsporus]PHZ14308.1 hypothetical protein RHIMIDRAFT_278799 [Rhizopus microsporus ATCC 52813]